MEFINYYNRLRSGFVGKSIGGTLGMPFEGTTDMLNLTYYDPIPTGAVGNDDLDLQVVWLECIHRYGLPINGRFLCEGWLEYVRGMWDEYGIAQRNFRHKLFSPLSGYYDNKFTSGFGAAIRTEIWAALAPGNPDLAVKFATEDSSIDHSGDGVDAARFIAAFESMAYTERNLDKIFNKAITYVKKDSRFYSAMHDARHWANNASDWRTVRDKIIKKYGVQNFTDVSVNISFIILGLFYGKGDFGKSICTAVNCGYDTDCIGATIGSILGILYPDRIPDEWVKPIGNDLVVSLCMVGLHPAKSIDEFCMQIAAVSRDVQEFYNTGVHYDNCPVFKTKYQSCWRSNELPALKTDERTSVITVSPFVISVKYPAEIAISMGETEKYSLTVLSDSDIELDLSLYMTPSFKISQGQTALSLKAGSPLTVDFEIKAPNTDGNNYLETLDISLLNKNGVAVHKCTAGIPIKTEWTVLKTDAKFKDCPTEEMLKSGTSSMQANHYIKVDSGVYYYAIDMKAPAFVNDAVMVAEGDRPMKVWIDGELISETDGKWYVPASHRGPGKELNKRCRINIRPEWHRVVIEVADGKPGEIFFGIFKPYGHEWLEDLETRRPI